VQNTQNFAPSTGLFEEGLVEDDDSAMHDDLEESISAVERVYQDMDARARTAADEAQGEEVEVIATEPIESRAEIKEVTPEPVAQAVEPEPEPEPEQEPYEPAVSPFETELDPVTGVYRLKVKPVSEETETSSGENHQSAGESQSHHVETVSEESHTPTDVTEQNNDQKVSYEQGSLFPRETMASQFEENAETLADEYENRPPDRQKPETDEAAEEFEREEQPAHPQESHN
jgi:hypothetical protein